MPKLVRSSTISAISILTGFSAMGAVVEFTVDPAASIFTASGTFNGVQFSEQTPGSTRTGFAGIIGGDLDGATLALTTNSVGSIDQVAPQRPAPNADDAGFAAFGLMAQAAMVGQAFFAIDSASLYLSTEFRPPLEIGDGTFAASDVGFFIEGGTIYFASDQHPLTYIDLHGYGAPNRATALGTFTTRDGVQTLTIPIETTIALTAASPDDSSLTLSGQIVATRVVPEPTTTLLLMGGCLLARRRQGPQRA